MAARTPTPLYKKSAYALAAIHLGGVLFVLAQCLVIGRIGDMEFLARTSIPQILPLGIMFLVLSKFEQLKAIQAFYGLIVAVILEIAAPGDSTPVYFLAVSISLLVKFKFFAKNARPKILWIAGVVLAGGLVGAMIAPSITVSPLTEPTNRIHLLQYTFMTVCLMLIEVAIFKEELGGILFKATAVVEPEFVIAQDYNLTSKQFSALTLRYSERLSAKEAAVVMGIAANSVNTHLVRAYKLLGCGSSYEEFQRFMGTRYLVWNREAADKILEEFRNKH